MSNQLFKMKRITNSLSGRLALMFAFASLTFVAIYGVVLRNSLHSSLQEQMHNELSFRANLIDPLIKSLSSRDSWQYLGDKLSDLSSVEGERVKYGFFSDDSSLNNALISLSQLPWQSLADGFSKISPLKADSCSLFLYVATAPFNEGSSRVRYVIAIDSTYYMGTLTKFTNTLIIITIIGVLLVAYVGFIIARIGLGPVKNLSEQTQHLLPGHHNQRLDTATLSNELQGLAFAFNDLLQRQEIAWLQLESFNADVAHELKTPLTNLVGQTQLGLVHKHEMHELKDLMGSNLEELERMTSIVNDMLFLSHAQAGEHVTQRTMVSISKEAQKTVEYIEPLLAEKNLQIEIAGEAWIAIDHRLFHRALANLLSNSTRYAEPDSVVKVSILHDARGVSVAVSNQGAPIADEQLDRLFERFYRADSARSRSHTHHGLGLAIVKAVALMHRGKVFARSAEGINTFGLTLAFNIANPIANGKS